MPQISVIVPIYKVEQYLTACVDSILVQTFTDFELILVDDGSPDNCGAMCDAYAAQDPRVKVIHQQNGGLSAARNAGLDIAIGTFITFIDGDDVVSANYLYVLHDLLLRSNADVSCCVFTEFHHNPQNVCIEEAGCKVTTLTGRKACLNIYNSIGLPSVSACGKLYSQILIGEKRFPIGKLHEDQFFVPIVLSGAKTVTVINAGLYFYRINHTSITHSQFSVRRFDNLEGIETCIRYFQTLGDKELVIAAKRARKRIMAHSNILAINADIHDQIPKKYQIREHTAVRDCFLYTKRDSCAWYLSLLYPSKVKWIDLSLKLRSIFLRY